MKPSAADRALQAAGALFYERGITATGMDLIAVRSGVAKTTMYAHFGSKDGIVGAYLRTRSATWRAHLRAGVQRRSSEPREQLLAVFDVLAESMEEPDFRGCPFINAAAELCDPEHPGVAATVEHRTWMRGYLTQLAQAAGARDAAGLAADLLLLYDAALVHGALDRSAGAAAHQARRSAQILMAAGEG